MQVLPALVTGGVERGTVDIANALVEAGWRAIVVSSGGPMTRELERGGAQHIDMPVHSKNPIVMRANADRLAALIDEHEVDIVHARSRAPAWCARNAARRGGGARFMTTFHATYNLGLPLKRLYNSVMADGDRVIAISHFIADHAMQTYRIEPDRIRVIHRGIDVENFDPTGINPERLIKLSPDWRLRQPSGFVGDDQFAAGPVIGGDNGAAHRLPFDDDPPKPFRVGRGRDHHIGQHKCCRHVGAFADQVDDAAKAVFLDQRFKIAPIGAA
jgi:glycosyltransferase involved in cell wall biosynthesis